MNWGKGIIVVMALFMSFIIVLVIKLMSARVDLQSEDYYRKEISYEEEIAAQLNANELKEKISTKVDNQFVIIKLPNAMNFTNVIVDFIRLNNKDEDKQYKINGTNTFLIPTKELQKGQYLIEIRFKEGGKKYLQKEQIYI